MTKALMLWALLISPAAAVEIKSIPEELSVAPLSTPLLAPALAPIPTLAPVYVDPLAGLEQEMAQEALAAPRMQASLLPRTQVPALPQSSLPVTRVTRVFPADPTQQRAAGQRADGTQETAEQMVRRLLRANADQREELTDVFDGTHPQRDDAVFPEALNVGAVAQTRHGAFTLVKSAVKELPDMTVLLQRYDGPEGGRWVRTRRGPGTYEVTEWRGEHAPKDFGGAPLPASSYADLWLEKGRLTSNIETTGNWSRPASTFVNAKKEFEAALAYFGDKVTSIQGVWVYGDNLAEFNRLTAEGLTPEQAALKTWTGQRAAAAGFTKVTFPEHSTEELRTRGPGGYGKMSAVFTKP